MPIDPRILQAIIAQARSQASPSPMGPQGTAAPPTPTMGPGAVNAIGTTGVPVNQQLPPQASQMAQNAVQGILPQIQRQPQLPMRQGSLYGGLANMGRFR